MGIIYNLLSMVVYAQDNGDGAPGTAGDTSVFAGQLFMVLQWVFIGVAAVIVPFAIYLGFRLANATDEGKRREAKVRMLNVVATFFIILILAIIMMTQTFGMRIGDGPGHTPDDDSWRDSGWVGWNPPGGQGDGASQHEPGGTALSSLDPNRYLLGMTTGNNCKTTAIYIMANILAGNPTFRTNPPQGLASPQLLDGVLSAMSTNTVSGRRYIRGVYHQDSHRGTLHDMLAHVYTAVVTNGVPIAVITPGNNQHWEVVFAVDMSGGRITHVHVINPLPNNNTAVRRIPVEELGAPAGAGSGTPRVRFGVMSVRPLNPSTGGTPQHPECMPGEPCIQ